MPSLPNLTQVPWLVAAVMLASTIAGIVCLAVRDRELLKSPVPWLVVAGLAGAAIASGAYGWYGPTDAKNPELLSWIYHLAPQMIGSAIVSGIAYLTAKIAERVAEESLPQGVHAFRRLQRFVLAAPKGIAAGFVIGTLLLLLAPTPAVSVQWDLSRWAFFYRACVQLVPMLYVVAMCVLMLRLHRAFGKPKDATEAALKKRFVANASGSACFALLYTNHLSWPFVAVLWPGSRLGSDYYRYIEALQLPILTMVAISYLAILLLPFCTNEDRRFARYTALTENFGQRANGPPGRHWKLRYKWSRADRLIELVSEKMNLSHYERARAGSAYKAVAVTAEATALPRRRRRPWRRRAAAAKKTIAKAVEAAKSPATPQEATAPEVPRTLKQDEIKELYALHTKFLCEPAGSPRRAYALQNRWAPLLPECLLLVGSSSVPDLSPYPRHLQLTVAVAADTGLLPPETASIILDRFATSIDRRILEEYERAKKAIDSRQAS